MIEAFFTMLTNVLLFVLFALPGYILIKIKLLKAEDSIALSNIVIYVGMPFLFISNLIQINFTKEILLNIAFCLLFSIAFCSLFYFLSKFLTVKIEPEKTKGMTVFCITFTNCGFLGVPLAAAVFPENPEVVIYVFIFMLINTLMAWTIGVFEISRDKKHISIKNVFLNPLFISVIIGIILVFININDYIPQFTKFSVDLSKLVAPLSMMVLGIKFAETNILSIFKNKLMYLVSLFRLIILPILCMILIILLKLCFNITNELIFGLFIGTAVPSAALSTSFAVKYEGDCKNSVEFTLGSTLFSLFTISLLFYFLNIIV